MQITTLIASSFTFDQLTAAGNNITRGMVFNARRIIDAQRNMLCGVLAMGFIFGEARKQHPNGFHKLFPKKQGEKLTPGMFACSYSTANNYIKVAAAIWLRADAAGLAADLEAQVAAYVHAAMSVDTPADGIPVLMKLINTEWISMHQVMVELGVIKPARHRTLVNDAPADTPALPGLADYCQQAWQNTSAALGSFRELMTTDIPRLNPQQRHTLRTELRGLLAELDRLETAAPEL